MEFSILPLIGKYLQVPFKEYLEEQRAKLTHHVDQAALTVSCSSLHICQYCVFMLLETQPTVLALWEAGITHGCLFCFVHHQLNGPKICSQDKWSKAEHQRRLNSTHIHGYSHKLYYSAYCYYLMNVNIIYVSLIIRNAIITMVRARAWSNSK